MDSTRFDGQWTRRKFLGATAGAGAGLILLNSVPGIDALEAMTMKSGRSQEGVLGHFSNFGIDEKLLRSAISQAMSKGGDFADLFFQHRVTNYLALEDGEVNQAFLMVELGCGIRVLKGDQTGFAFTEDLSPDALGKAALTSAAVAQGSSNSFKGNFSAQPRNDFYPISVPWSDVTIQKKLPLLQKMNEVALAADPRIVKVKVLLQDVTGNVLVANSQGLIADDYQPISTAIVTCVAQAGGRREENYYALGQRQGFEFYTQETLEKVAKTAVERTLVLFEASPPPAGEYPIVLAPGVSGILLHEAMGHGMEADFNRKGTSVYADSIGKRVAPEFVTIVDDGTNRNARGSLNIDDEGTPGQRTVLIENGILVSYMHDLISAKHYKLNPTGNGRRDCYRFPPVPRMRNTYMLGGPHDPEEIIRSVKRGVYCQTFTNGQVRIGSGDFSFYLKNGYLIEDGKLTMPVKDANLIGFGPKVLEQVEMVGSDMTMEYGAGMCGKDGQSVPVGFGLPTVKCAGISVGGIG